MHLSRRISDEGYYYIAKIGETPRPPIAAAMASTPANGLGGGGSSPGGLIDLNSATAELLETLPSIGEVRAKAIVNYRETNGCFQSTSDVTKVSGIGSGIYEQIRDLVTASGCS